MTKVLKNNTQLTQVAPSVKQSQNKNGSKSPALTAALAETEISDGSDDSKLKLEPSSLGDFNHFKFIKEKDYFFKNSTKFSELLTVSCSYPHSVNESYAFQQSVLISVPVLTCFFIRGIKVFLSRLLAGQIDNLKAVTQIDICFWIHI